MSDHNIGKLCFAGKSFGPYGGYFVGDSGIFDSERDHCFGKPAV